MATEDGVRGARDRVRARALSEPSIPKESPLSCYCLLRADLVKRRR